MGFWRSLNKPFGWGKVAAGLAIVGSLAAANDSQSAPVKKQSDADKKAEEVSPHIKTLLENNVVWVAVVDKNNQFIVQGTGFLHQGGVVTNAHVVAAAINGKEENFHGEQTGKQCQNEQVFVFNSKGEILGKSKTIKADPDQIRYQQTRENYLIPFIELLETHAGVGRNAAEFAQSAGMLDGQKQDIAFIELNWEKKFAELETAPGLQFSDLANIKDDFKTSTMGFPLGFKLVQNTSTMVALKPDGEVNVKFTGYAEGGSSGSSLVDNETGQVVGVLNLVHGETPNSHVLNYMRTKPMAEIAGVGERTKSFVHEQMGVAVDAKTAQEILTGGDMRDTPTCLEENEEEQTR